MWSWSLHRPMQHWGFWLETMQTGKPTLKAASTAVTCTDQRAKISRLFAMLDIVASLVIRWVDQWKKSCTTLDGWNWNHINNGINHQSTGAGFLPSTEISADFNPSSAALSMGPWVQWVHGAGVSRARGLPSGLGLRGPTVLPSVDCWNLSDRAAGA